MKRTVAAVSAVFLVLLAGPPASAKAPRSKDVMQPIDTAAGTFSDPNNLLRVNMDAPVTVNVVNQPALVVFNQLKAKVGVDFGYEKGLDKEKLVSVSFEGPAREALKAIGRAGGMRFEATGPIQLRVLRAAGARVRKPPAEPPPAQHP